MKKPGKCGLCLHNSSFAGRKKDEGFTMNFSVDGSAYNNGINNANIGNDRNNTASINIAEKKINC